MRLRGSAQHLRRTLSEKPGPADRQTGHSIMQAAWWARGCTPAAASGLRPAGLGRRKLRSGLRALAGLHAATACRPLDPRQQLELDSRIYLLMRKTS